MASGSSLLQLWAPHRHSYIHRHSHIITAGIHKKSVIVTKQREDLSHHITHNTALALSPPSRLQQPEEDFLLKTPLNLSREYSVICTDRPSYEPTKLATIPSQSRDLTRSRRRIQPKIQHLLYGACVDHVVGTIGYETKTCASKAIPGWNAPPLVHAGPRRVSVIPNFRMYGTYRYRYSYLPVPVCL
jgi:hypothetical protein